MDTEEIVYKVDVSELEDNVRKTAEAVEASVAEIGESYRKIDFSVWDTDLLSALKHINDLKAAMEEVEAAMDSGDEEAQKEARQNLDEAVDRFAKGMAGAGMGDLGKAFEFAAENLQKIVDMSGDERMSETADALSSVGQTLNAAAQGAATGGWIGAVVGAATDIASQIGEALTAARVEEEEYLKNREDFLREYAKQNLQLKDEDYESVFGTASVKKAQDAYSNAQKAMQEYLNGSSGLLSMQVKTKDHSGLANLFGVKDEFTALKDMAPELFDSGTMELDVDAAKVFLQTNTQISDEQRQQIQNVIDMKDAYDEAIETVRDQISGIFGQLSGEITDAIAESVLNSTSAWDAFEQSGVKVMDSLARQFIQEKIVKAYLDGYEDDMIAAMSSENPQETLAEVMGTIYQGLGNVYDTAATVYGSYMNLAESYGLDMGRLAGSTAVAQKGIAAASQDSVDELNGRMTAVQGHTFSIAENSRSLVANTSRMLEHLAGIEDNTGELARLENIETCLSDMRRTVNAFKSQGIRVR